MSTLEEKLQERKLQVSDGIKKHIFDWVAAIIIVATLAASLDIFGIIDINTINYLEFLVSWFPYFAAAILLQRNFYKKGVFVGKSTSKFTGVIDDYSEIANSLTGNDIKELYPFCDEYNDSAKKSMQLQILRKEGLTFEEFDVGLVIDNKKARPLKILSRKELRTKYTSAQIRAIRRAKRVKVKGINVNILLSSIDIDDVTDIGNTEKKLDNTHTIWSIIRYGLSTFLLSVIVVKDISTWGWMGVILASFKVVYLFAGSYMSYFKGYDNITIDLANHFTRKTDILKMYLQYVPSIVEEQN